MPELQVLISGLAFPESPRWHEDRLWFSDWGAHEVIAVDLAGKREVIASVPSFPIVNEWGGAGNMADETRAGQVLTAEAPASGVGWP